MPWSANSVAEFGAMNAHCGVLSKGIYSVMNAPIFLPHIAAGLVVSKRFKMFSRCTSPWKWDDDPN
jgi:hypothetical protein